MNRTPPKNADPFNFKRLLTPDVLKGISDFAKWRWVSAFDKTELPCIHHPQHARWSRVQGNTHTPAFREIMLTIKGRAVYSFEGDFYERKPGTVFLLDGKERRDLNGAEHKRNFSCVWLRFLRRDYLTFHVSHCDIQARYRHDPGVIEKFGESVQLVTEAWDHCIENPTDQMGKNLLKSSIASVLLEMLGRATSNPITDPHQQSIHSVVDYIDTHLADELTLERLASLAGYSRFFFHRLFVHHTGQTPVEYINSMRLMKAKQLLLQNHTIEAITEIIGFASASYFSQLFKKHVGISPLAWRQMQLQGGSDEPSHVAVRRNLRSQFRERKKSKI